MNSQPHTEQNTPERKADIERLMRENGVEPFAYDEAVGEGKDLWTDKEFDEFQDWLRDQRRENKQQGRIDSHTILMGVPGLAWEYKLGNRSALKWILDQYKEKKPQDATIAERFNTYKFADYKEQTIDLLSRVCSVSITTMNIVNQMPQS